MLTFLLDPRCKGYLLHVLQQAGVLQTAMSLRAKTANQYWVKIEMCVIYSHKPFAALREDAENLSR